MSSMNRLIAVPPFHGEMRRLKNRRRAFEQEPDDFDVSFIHHGFSTSIVPSLRRVVQRPLLNGFPAAFFAAAAHGKFNSSAQLTQSRTTLTRRQFLTSVVNTSGRSDSGPLHYVAGFFESLINPTSLNISSNALSGTETRTPSGVSGSGCKPKFFGSLEENGFRLV